ncbi:MAG TPA: hypothetical protein VFO70_08815 [Chitinophagaceae bacterium]|nr:hypothetical protein [Chitinophagaceae bacterium]
MKNESALETKVRETLDSLEGIQRVGPQPYFYTRLMARLQRDEKSIWASAGTFLARPINVIAGICFILLVNGFVLFRQDKPVTKASQVTNTNELVTDNAYILASSSSFDYENFDQ